MNLLLDNVVSEITGTTGMTIIRAIVDGEREPRFLAKHRDSRCKKSVADMAKLLKGNYRDEHLFSLRQSVELYDIYDQKISACDKALEQKLKSFDSKENDDSKPSSEPDKPLKARLVYSMFQHGSQYIDEGQDYYERKYKDRVMKNLKQKAMEMEFALVPAEADSSLTAYLAARSVKLLRSAPSLTRLNIYN